MKYIGLDLAIVSGICVIDTDTNTIDLFQHKGTPIELLDWLFAFIIENEEEGVDSQKMGIEELHQFRNANTTRSLLQRSGYIFYTLSGYKFTVEMVNMESVLPVLKCKNKKELFEYALAITKHSIPITSNHSDALGIALYLFYTKEGYVLDTSDYVFTLNN